MLRFGLFAGRLSHEIALFHCLRAILRFSLELHFFIVMYLFFFANCLSPRSQWVLLLFENIIIIIKIRISNVLKIAIKRYCRPYY